MVHGTNPIGMAHHRDRGGALDILHSNAGWMATQTQACTGEDSIVQLTGQQQHHHQRTNREECTWTSSFEPRGMIRSMCLFMHISSATAARPSIKLMAFTGNPTSQPSPRELSAVVAA